MTVAEMGITKEELKLAGISHYNLVLNAEYKEGAIVYIAQTPQCYNYKGYQKNTTRAYIVKDGHIECLFYNLKNHRALKAINAWNNGDVGTVIPTWVWENYITNGYNTRRGLYADYSKKEDRMKRIAISHSMYLGCEIDSKTDHYNRVRMRNN